MSAASNRSNRDPWPCPMKQVTGLGLDHWQLHSGHPEEVKSGICSHVNMSHSCDNSCDNGGTTRPHAVRTAQHTYTQKHCVYVCILLCGSSSQATSVCAISMFGWLGWPHYMATFHTAPSVCLSVSLAQSLLHTPLPTHYSVPLYCSYSTWLQYSVASSTS